MEDSKYNYKLLIAYDGTQYGGWQVQPNAISIQALVQDAVRTFSRQEVSVIGSGRTDAGVHATGQVAHFKTLSELDIHRLLASLNGMLPRDIRVLRIEEVPFQFHAQRSALSKTYHYHLWLDRVQSPFKRLYSLHVHDKIDLTLLKHAATQFIGTHDFTSFANEAHTGSAAYDAVRTLERLDVISEEGGVRLEFTGNGFLYKMVRNMTGTMLEVASGKLDVSEIPKIFSARDRRQAGQAVPPHGLFLVNVKYSN